MIALEHAVVLPDETLPRSEFLTDLLACFRDKLAPALTLLSGYRGWLQIVPAPRPPAPVSVWWRSPSQPAPPGAVSPAEFFQRRLARLRRLLRHQESLLERLPRWLGHCLRQPLRHRSLLRFQGCQRWPPESRLAPARFSRLAILSVSHCSREPPVRLPRRLGPAPPGP